MSRFIICLFTMGLFLVPLECWYATAQEAEPPDLTEGALSDLSGEIISLDAEEVDIRALLRLIAHTRHLNIVAGPEVMGTVSVNFFEVPFEDALSAILGIGGFTHFTKGGVIFVTTDSSKAELPMEANDLDVRTYDIQHVKLDDFVDTIESFLSTSGTVAINDKRLIVQDAPQYLVRIDKLVETLDVPPNLATVFEIKHVDPQEILTSVNQLLSPNGNASLSSGDKLVVQDTPEYLVVIEDLIAQLDTMPRQVLISAKVLDVAHDDELSLGFEFEYDNNLDLNASEPIIENLQPNSKMLNTGQAGLFALVAGNHEFGFLEALSQKSKVEVLSAPQLLTLDGEMAKIQIGERLGFRITTTTETSSLESVEFLEVGTILEVTPSINKEGLIHMEVHPKVSTGAISAEGLPEEKTTEAKTVMQVRDGETILIGGLINTTKQRTRLQVPLLGDIPVLGLLFGRNKWKDIKSELIILITPQIVEAEAIPPMQEQMNQVKNFEQDSSTEYSDAKRLFGKTSMPRNAPHTDTYPD